MAVHCAAAASLPDFMQGRGQAFARLLPTVRGSCMMADYTGASGAYYNGIWCGLALVTSVCSHACAACSNRRAYFRVSLGSAALLALISLAAAAETIWHHSLLLSAGLWCRKNATPEWTPTLRRSRCAAAHAGAGKRAGQGTAPMRSDRCPCRATC